MQALTEAAVAAHAARQHGLVTRAQLQEAGVGSSTIWRRVDSGLLVPVGARTYRLASSEPTDDQSVLAVCLDRGAVGSDRTGLWKHGLMELGGTIDVTVAKGRSVLAEASDHRTVRVRTSTNLPAADIVVVDGIEVTNLARSLMGAAALVPELLTDAQLLDLVSAAIETRRASLPWLRWMLEERRCRGRNGVAAFERALDARVRLGPTESWLERRTLRLLGEAGLPQPLLQQKIARGPGRAARVDFLFVMERVVLEVLGYAFHRTPEQITIDLLRANELQIAGYTVIQLTSRVLSEDPAVGLDQVERALQPDAPRARLWVPGAPGPLPPGPVQL